MSGFQLKCQKCSQNYPVGLIAIKQVDGATFYFAICQSCFYTDEEKAAWDKAKKI